MFFIAEGYQPDCDGPVRWLESVKADTIEQARELVMGVYNASGDLCPDAVYCEDDARARFGHSRINRLFEKPMGYKENADASASYTDADAPGAVPFFYYSFQYNG